MGKGFLWLTLASEALLLFVAAQAGFIDGPRVMANMSIDSWLPHRFAQLSDRLTMQNGVLLMGLASARSASSTPAATSRTLVTLYAINVFLTFSLSQAGDVPLLVPPPGPHGRELAARHRRARGGPGALRRASSSSTSTRSSSRAPG